MRRSKMNGIKLAPLCEYNMKSYYVSVVML